MTALLDVTSILAAVIYVLIAAAVGFEIRRLGIGMPRVAIVLVVYFLVRAIDLLAAPDPLFGYSKQLDAVTDLAVIGLLLVILASARRVARASLATVNEARLRLEEYERARHDYSVAVHAKIAGPLSVISGAAQSLETSGHDPEARRQLSELIAESTRALRTASEAMTELRGRERP